MNNIIECGVQNSIWINNNHNNCNNDNDREKYIGSLPYENEYINIYVCTSV